MGRILVASVLSICGFALLAPSACADVIVRGPFGQLIVISAPVDVRVGPGVFVGVPGRAQIYPPAPVVVQAPFANVVVSKPLPVIRVEGETVLPPPKIVSSNYPPPLNVELGPQPAATAAISPHEFAKTFKASPNAASYEVLFMHPLNHKAVSVTFNLPAGNPRVTYHATALVFDYGRGQQVEVRFQVGGKVRVTANQ